jgi:hypothetical protein
MRRISGHRNKEGEPKLRFALSAAAALSGTLLLGLAFYGQPAWYIHQAREQWDELIESPLADLPAEPDRGSSGSSVAVRSQQRVRQSGDDLAAKPSPFMLAGASPSVSDPASPALVPAVQPEPLVSRREASANDRSHTDSVRVEADAAARSQAPLPAASAAAPRHVTALVERAPVKPEPAKTVQLTPAQARSELLSAASTGSANSKLGSPASEAANPEPPRPEPIRGEMARSEAAGSEPPRSGPNGVDPGQMATPKFASAKPVPPPPSLPPRQDTSDAQSVLARLRQLAPGSVPARQGVPADAKPRQTPSALLSGLAAARTALANGRIEDARRLLQQTQLQLVFRPVNAAGDDSPLAGKGAADVAHALEALGANDISLSRRYVEVAMGDMSGSATNTGVQESQMRTNGYAPAYPPR